MKTFELKQKSWHYWLANFGDQRIHTTTNICEYVRCMLIGAMLLSFSVLAVSLFGGATLFTIGNIFSWLFFGYEFHNLSAIMTGTFSSIALMFLFIVGKAKLNETENEPGFVRLAYRSWKDKYCARIELK
jgi:hypothetical protein